MVQHLLLMLKRLTLRRETDEMRQAFMQFSMGHEPLRNHNTNIYTRFHVLCLSAFSLEPNLLQNKNKITLPTQAQQSSLFS